uniref:MFT-like protein n=1 Tax=Ephedra przewalskii TaxID=257425 RepID=A0A1B1LTG4_9SPER|nr:MFT-like protein [Ephedra przewalskii]
MAVRSVDPLVVGKVIGDVLEMFAPSAELSVHYGSKQVTNGCEIKPSLTVERPAVRISDRSRVNNNYHFNSSAYGNNTELYTLVMTDPDAPSPSEPAMREWLHWIVTDIPANTDVSQGREIVPYTGPKPPIGIHRYVIAVFRQQGPMVLMVAPPVRQNFCTRAFAAQHGLGLPVAAVYFNAQKEPANKKR